VTERQILRDAVSISRINDHSTAETAAALGTLGLRQVASARAGAQDFAASRYLEAFGHGLSGLDAFGTSHKSKFFNRKRGRTLRRWWWRGKRFLRVIQIKTA
jgi:hypothetical protein